MSSGNKRVGIIGGSIAGCAAAIAFSRAGYRVEVYERSSRGLNDRGSGIALPMPLRNSLVEADYLPREYPVCPLRMRWWQYHDGTPIGRRLWSQPTPTAASNNWGMLWRALRARVDDACYHEGKQLAGFDEMTDHVQARFADGTTERFDLLVGADGYHSAVRNKLHPHVQPEFAGYILWRGNYPEDELQDRSYLDAMDADNAWLTVPFQGGHGVMYPIPNFDSRTDPGHRRVNWAIYAPVPDALDLNSVESIPPGALTPEVYQALLDLLAADFPEKIAELFRHSRRQEVSIQPIFDSVVDTYVSDRTLLIGDAGTMTRPHTASGATKALEDALALERLAKTTPDMGALLEAYDQERAGVAKTMSGLGQRIGRAQVLQTPDWATMGPAEFGHWIEATLAGDTLYLYGEPDEAA